MALSLPTESLIAALSTIPAGCTLVKNPVGNLAIFDQHGDYVGFVDLQTGEVDTWMGVGDDQNTDLHL